MTSMAIKTPLMAGDSTPPCGMTLLAESKAFKAILKAFKAVLDIYAEAFFLSGVLRCLSAGPLDRDLRSRLEKGLRDICSRCVYRRWGKQQQQADQGPYLISGKFRVQGRTCLASCFYFRYTYNRVSRPSPCFHPARVIAKVIRLPFHSRSSFHTDCDDRTTKFSADRSFHADGE